VYFYLIDVKSILWLSIFKCCFVTFLPKTSAGSLERCDGWPLATLSRLSSKTVHSLVPTMNSNFGSKQIGRITLLWITITFSNFNLHFSVLSFFAVHIIALKTASVFCSINAPINYFLTSDQCIRTRTTTIVFFKAKLYLKSAVTPHPHTKYEI
jgi:hypothetical protein